jgi:preprotein translocase subunit YajC
MRCKTLFTTVFGSLFFSTTAFADAPVASGGMSGAMSQIVLLGGFFVIFYFFILRPQNKRAKAHRDLLSQLSKGDEITTNGGILGKVTRVADDFLLLMVAEGVEIRVQKQAVAHVLPKGTFKSV